MVIQNIVSSFVLRGARTVLSKAVFVFAVFISVLFVYSVFAAHVITFSSGTSSVNVQEDISNRYNITVNNSDSGSGSNITQVNITFPSSFTVDNNTASTNAVATLTSNSTILSWQNGTYVVNGSQIRNFWVNASASTPGVYNITVTTVNATGSFSSNISVVVNDTTPASFSYVTDTDSDGSNVSRGNIIVNVSASDNGVLGKIVVRLYNSTRSLLNTSISSSIGASNGSYRINFVNLTNGTYYFNATVNDTYGNPNSSISTYQVIVDTVAPSVSLNSPSNYTSTTATTMNFTFNVTETNNLLDCSLYFGGSFVDSLTVVASGTYGIYRGSLSAGTYNWSINCTDTSNNVGMSEHWILTVTAASTSDSESSGSSGGGGLGLATYPLTEKSLSNGGVKKTFASGTSAKFMIGLESHLFKALSIDAKSKKISFEIRSNPVQATLGVGEKGTYDLGGGKSLLVEVLGFRGSLADVKMTLVEAPVVQTPSITTEPAKEEVQSSPASELTSVQQSPENSQQSSGSFAGMIVAIVVIAIVLFVVLVVMKKSKKR